MILLSLISQRCCSFTILSTSKNRKDFNNDHSTGANGRWTSWKSPSTSRICNRLNNKNIASVSSKDQYDDHNLAEVDMLYSTHRSLTYDSKLDRYLPISSYSSNKRKKRTMQYRIKSYIKAAFLPESVHPSYYEYMKWRFLQRFLSAVVHVFGTQSLLLGLGKQRRAAQAATATTLGLGAALSWVMKDALGKLVRMVWASKMGRKFDPDAKRWRFRSSLLFAFGNFLEICACMHPSFFLSYATISNSLKQMSLLASSATRNAIYNCFKIDNRENIGDITAKGEAQIAVVDLLGIGAGIALSKTMGISSIKNILITFFILQTIEICAMYREIRSVVFSVLNFERLYTCVDLFVSCENRNDSSIMPTPAQMAHDEKIFLPPNHLSRRNIAFGSFSRVYLNPSELQELQRIFSNQKYLVLVGENLKKRHAQKTNIEDQCHVVLHTDAKNIDIVKSTLALALLRSKLKKRYPSGVGQEKTVIRSSTCFDLLKVVKEETNVLFPKLLKMLQQQGWNKPAKNVFGSSSIRADWTISNNKEQQKKQDNNVGNDLPITTTTANIFNGVTTVTSTTLNNTPSTNATGINAPMKQKNL